MQAFGNSITRPAVLVITHILGCLNLFVRLNRIFDHFQYSVFKVQTMITNVIIQTIIIDCLGLSGLEPPTSRLSGVRSNRLSYKPRLLSKCADIWGYARGACTPEHKSLWMHMRRSRGMTNRRFGIPALTNCKCWRIRLLLVLS